MTAPGSGPDRLARGRADTLADWIHATGHGTHQVLHPPGPIPRGPLPALDHPLPDLHRVHRVIAPAAYLATIPDGLVWGTEGTVVTPDGHLVLDLTRAWGRAPEHHPIWNTPAPGTVTTLEGSAAVVAARGAADNFSHFLADTLPRIQLIRDAGHHVDTWILSGTHHPWQQQALAHAGIGPRDTISLTDHPTIRAEHLLVPSRTGFAPATAPWARDTLTRLLNQPPHQRFRKLLISRAHATRRRLTNEDKLATVLADLGFETVHFDHLHLAEQIRLIHQAHTIVATHGAALSHLLHAPPGGTVIEIADPTVAHPEYWGLAALAGWVHHLVPATSTASGHDAITDDWTVPLNTVRHCLDLS